jgi:hypothetical protein
MVCDMALVCRSARDLIRGIKVPEYIFSIIIPHQQLASVGVTILDLVEYFLFDYYDINIARYYSLILGGAHLRVCLVLFNMLNNIRKG